MDNTKELRTLSLCTGYGGIERGIELAGTKLRTLAHVEIEAFAIANLVAKMEEGELDPCPIWTDLKTFPDPEAMKMFMIDRDVNLSYSPGSTFEENGLGAKRMTKYDAGPGMYESGLSIEDIGSYFGVSRQSMHQILKRRGVVFRDNKRYGDENHFKRNGLVMNKNAQQLVARAIKKGILTQSPCESCGDSGKMSDGRNKVHAHHDDYNHPLNVRWLCQQCHHEWHKTNNAIPLNGENEPTGFEDLDLLTGGFP